jgi:hypothetical protein
MKSRFLMCFSVIALFAALAMPLRLPAQDNQSSNHKHHHYKLIDMGTFGGPSSAFVGVGAHALNNAGVATGGAELPIPDPNAPNCFSPDCFVVHTFLWQNGVLTDLDHSSLNN